MKKNSTKKRTTKTNAKVNPAPKKNFERWILPGLITITLYLVTVLVAALLIKHEGGLSMEAGNFLTILYMLTLATGFWWLIESARWIINGIDRRAASKLTSKKK